MSSNAMAMLMVKWVGIRIRIPDPTHSLTSEYSGAQRGAYGIVAGYENLRASELTPPTNPSEGTQIVESGINYCKIT